MNFMNSYLIRKTPKGIKVVYADDTNIACHTLEDKSNVLFCKNVSTIYYSCNKKENKINDNGNQLHYSYIF